MSVDTTNEQVEVMPNSNGLMAIPEEFQKLLTPSDAFERRNRVTDVTIILMLATAGFYDLLQFGLNFIPLLGNILAGLVGVFSWLTFYVWGSIKGWGFTDTVKKIVVRVVLPFLGLIPVFNWGPEITIGVALTILIIKSDDFVYNKTKGKVDTEKIIQGLQFFKLFREV